MRKVDREAQQFRRTRRWVTLAELAAKYPEVRDPRDEQAKFDGTPHPQQHVQHEGYAHAWRTQRSVDPEFREPDEEELMWRVLLGNRRLFWKRVAGREDSDYRAADCTWVFADNLPTSTKWDSAHYRNRAASIEQYIGSRFGGDASCLEARPIWEAAPGDTGHHLRGQDSNEWATLKDPWPDELDDPETEVLRVFAWANQQKLSQHRRYRKLADALDLAMYASLDFAEAMLDLVVLAYPDFLDWQAETMAAYSERAVTREKAKKAKRPKAVTIISGRDNLCAEGTLYYEGEERDARITAGGLILLPPMSKQPDG